MLLSARYWPRAVTSTKKQEFKRSKTAKISNWKGRKDENVTKANHLIDKDKTWKDILNHLYQIKPFWLYSSKISIGRFQLDNSPNKKCLGNSLKRQKGGQIWIRKTCKLWNMYRARHGLILILKKVLIKYWSNPANCFKFWEIIRKLNISRGQK